MVAILMIHAIAWITTHLPTPEGWKAEFRGQDLLPQEFFGPPCGTVCRHTPGSGCRWRHF